jgi:hypothetical protein
MVSIKGVRLDSISITKEGDESKITGAYALISSTDAVLAKQSFNGYEGMKVVFSPATIQALRDFIKGAKGDLETILGLNEPEGEAK